MSRKILSEERVPLNEYQMTKRMLGTIRMAINEESGEQPVEKAVAITDDARFGQNVLSSQIEQFKSAVDSGAQFSKASPDNVGSSPLIAYPETEDVTFSGTIPRLGNLKFQFKLRTNTGKGCFVWADEMIIDEENIGILNKIFGFYQNWCDEWNTSSSDLFTMLKNRQNQ